LVRKYEGYDVRGPDRHGDIVLRKRDRKSRNESHQAIAMAFRGIMEPDPRKRGGGWV
jgi:hypothetical protein